MTITSLDINGTSYPSLATPTEADAYLAIDPVRGIAWNGLDDTTKESRLAMASRRFNLIDWIGVKTDASQSLAWPRTQQDGELLTVNGTEIPKDSLPKPIQDACILLAGTSVLRQNATAIAPISGQRIEDVKAGSVMVRFWHPNIVSIDPADIRAVDGEVYELIAPYIMSQSLNVELGTAGSGDAPDDFAYREFESAYPFGSGVFGRSAS